MFLPWLGFELQTLGQQYSKPTTRPTAHIIALHDITIKMDDQKQSVKQNISASSVVTGPGSLKS